MPSPDAYKVTVNKDVMTSDGRVTLQSLRAAAEKDKDFHKKIYTDENNQPDHIEEPTNQADTDDTDLFDDAKSDDVLIDIKSNEPNLSAKPTTKVASPAAESGDIEAVMVAGPSGQKTKLEINYGDRAATKKAHMEAAGMRKFQAERDAARKEANELKAKLAESTAKVGSISEKETHYGRLEEVWAKEGLRGLVKILDKEGEKQLDALLDDRKRRLDYLNTLSPEEKLRLELKEREEYAAKRSRDVEELYKKKLEELDAKEKSSAVREFQSRVNPVFDKYRFSGKLGNESVERLYDKTLWSEVSDILDAYPDDVERTPALVEKTFKEVSSNMRSMLRDSDTKRVTEIVNQKSDEAMSKVQNLAKSGTTTGATSARELKKQALDLAAQGKIRKANILWGQIKQRLAR